MAAHPDPEPPGTDVAVVPMTHAPVRDVAPVQYTRADREVDDITAARLADSVPPNTQRSYAAAGTEYRTFCTEAGRVAVPGTAETFAAFVSHLIDLGRAPATISNRIGAIRTMHTAAGYEGSPPVKAALQLLRGYKRARAEAGISSDEARPFTRDDLLRMVATLDRATFPGLRDQLVFTLGFALMARRSELSGLHIGDVADTPDGLVVKVRTSKADKESKGREVALPAGAYPDICPVTVYRAYRAKLAEHARAPGALAPHTPLIRSVTKHGTPRANAVPVSTIWEITRRAVLAAQLPDPHEYSPHSLRAGGLTSALQNNALIGVAARHGGWSPTSPVVNQYARTADRWRNNAMRGVY